MARGPYVLASREPDARTVLTRNPDYWGALDGDIDEIVFQPISSDPTRIAALVSGELDLVTAIPSQNVAQLEANPDIKLEITDEFRTLFYAFDVGSEVLKHGDAGGTNPFSDRRVRQAVNLALDSEAIVRTVMRGYATPTGQILAPGNVGYDAELDALSGYDPTRRRGSRRGGLSGRLLVHPRLSEQPLHQRRGDLPGRRHDARAGRARRVAQSDAAGGVLRATALEPRLDDVPDGLQLALLRRERTWPRRW